MLTHGLHYGSSIFEGERAYAGKIFKSTEHSERFHKSASILNFALPYSVEEITKAKDEVVRANSIVDGYIRPVAWRGSEMMAVSAQKSKIHVAIAAWQWPSMFKPEVKEKGIRLAWAKYKRPSGETEPVHAKAAGLYMICTVSKHAAEAAGYDDALMLDYRGYLAEATGANLFLVIDGELHTPTPDCFLNGITRQTVIELAKKRNITVVERHMEPRSSTARRKSSSPAAPPRSLPSAKSEGKKFTPGAITRQLMDDYSALVRAHAKDKAA
ncbi:MAG: branched-chain amino acid aminotransferase [Alphaproteobacteria bacterium]